MVRIRLPQLCFGFGAEDAVAVEVPVEEVVAVVEVGVVATAFVAPPPRVVSVKVEVALVPQSLSSLQRRLRC